MKANIEEIKKVAEQNGVNGEAAARVIELAVELFEKTNIEVTYTNIHLAVREAVSMLTRFYEEILAAKTERALKVREQILAATFVE